MKRAFTLIELLVVIAIIGVLSSVILASLNNARGKANDAKIRADMHSLQTALTLYYDKHGSFPTNPTPCCGSQISTALPALVSEGFIGSLPVSPNATNPYYYYDYGANNTVGAIIVAYFTTTPPSTEYPGSCRPWAPAQNWCSTSSDQYYCLCNPY